MTVKEFEVFAIAAAVAAMWAQIRSWLAWPIGLLVVSHRVDVYSSGAVLSYLHATARWKPSGGNYYSSERPFVRPIGRVYRVWYEALKEGRQTFWLRRRPVWYAPHQFGPSGEPRETTVGRFSYLRWTIDWDRLLEDAAALEDVGLCDLAGEARDRFRVTVHGQQSTSQTDTRQCNAPPASSGNLTNVAYGQRLLRWKPTDLLARVPLALENLSLRPELACVAERVRRWAASREWFEEHGVPWRLGLHLHGAPGTGKTSLARGLAAEHNLPVNVFDIASLDNYTLRTAWSNMLADAPCMALIEDIDGTFVGRTPVGDHVHVTFDCLLNAISGVQAADGVLLVVTSNRPETVDPALLRPGRLDLHVEVLGLDRAGRVKMARRILGDDLAAARAADDRAITHEDGVEVSPAVFQERLCRLALAERFGDAA